MTTRVWIFLRFAVIFLRSPVIPLIPPVSLCRYCRNSFENWSWPTEFFDEKPLFPPISHKKYAGKIFWSWCSKGRTPSENQISPKRKTKDVAMCLFQNGGYNIPKSSPRKVREKSGKIKFHTKNRQSVPSSSTVFVGVKIVWQLYLLFFFFWLALFVFLDVLSLFDIVPYLNLVVWISNWCHFCDISIRFVSYWGPIEATFSSWILSSGLNCARELTASSLKHQDCCSQHLQTWFVEGNVVRQLDSRFWSFWLASWGGPKLKTFAVNVERQRWKIRRPNFSKIVAIRSPPLFF